MKHKKSRELNLIFQRRNYNNNDPEAKTFLIDASTDDVTIVPIGDVHWGHKDCDYKMFQKVIKWCKKQKNVYLILMGDLVEASIMNSPGLFDQNTFLHDQLKDMVTIFKPFAEEHHILGVLEGNHERRVKRTTAIDIMEDFCDRIGLDVKKNYFGAGALLLIGVGNTTHREFYTLYCTHGSSFAQFPQTKLMACMRLQTIAEAEIYCMGHVHSLNTQKNERYAIMDVYDWKKKAVTKQLVKRPIHYVLTGQYLKYWGTYAQEKGIPPSGDSGSPKIHLHVKEHRVSVSL